MINNEESHGMTSGLGGSHVTHLSEIRRGMQ